MTSLAGVKCENNEPKRNPGVVVFSPSFSSFCVCVCVLILFFVVIPFGVTNEEKEERKKITIIKAK